MNVPYIPGSGPPPQIPLGRFLPPIPKGMCAQWCRENLKQGDWVLDPFGFNPLVPIEIASAGYPVLVTVNNPIHAFILKILASAPTKEELIAALQDLATAPKGDDRMEPYIRSLYEILCGKCSQKIEVDAFLWKKEQNQPFAALVECPFCGAVGEQKLTDEMLANLTPLPSKRLHQARALNRIVDMNDSLRPQVEQALNAYPTRPLIILQTIINKLESLEQTPRRRDLLIGLILSAADRGNTLWAHPTPRSRPRQIVIPSIYQEENLWKTMLEAVETWQVLDKPIPILDWEEKTSQTTGIFRFQGRIKELDRQQDSVSFAAVATAVPRPNQAFWTLSALWTGWIWGQDAIAPIRQVLSRQRYDWNWHFNALKSVFDSLLPLHHPSQKYWGMIPENEPMLLVATLLASNSAGFKLSTFAHSIDDQLAQCQWEPGQNSSSKTKPDYLSELIKNKITNYLQQKGEPATYQQIHTAAVAALAHEEILANEFFLNNYSQATSEAQKWIEKVFNEPGLLKQVGGGTASLETGDYWLVDATQTEKPLIDRVEERIVQHLVSVKTSTAEAVKTEVYQAFPGIFTPEDALLLNCLDSYADLVDTKTHCWMLRENEHPAARRADIADINASLVEIGQRLNFQTQTTDPVLWYEDGNPIAEYCFHVFASAIVSKYNQNNFPSAKLRLLVIPGSRANLLAFKKQRDPILKQTLDRDFLVLKFRLVRDLIANPLLSRKLFTQQIDIDPPEYRSSQLALF